MLVRFCTLIDVLNEWTGKITAWLMLPLCFIVVYDVFLRYVLNNPTVWAWDLNTQMLGLMVALGGGYAFLYGSHVGVDVFVVYLSKKGQILVELITSTFFFIGIGVLSAVAIKQAWISVKTMEIDSTFFAPPVYPLKVLIAAGFLLLLLQGFAKFIRGIVALRAREEDNT